MKTAFSHVLPCMLAGIMLSSAPDFCSAQEIPGDSKEAAAEKADSDSYPALTSDVLFSLIASEIAVQRHQSGYRLPHADGRGETDRNPGIARRAFKRSPIFQQPRRRQVKLWRSGQNLPPARLKLKCLPRTRR